MQEFFLFLIHLTFYAVLSIFSSDSFAGLYNGDPLTNQAQSVCPSINLLCFLCLEYLFAVDDGGDVGYVDRAAIFNLQSSISDLLCPH